jgi:thiol-disulfide isomerase/thioredoxin
MKTLFQSLLLATSLVFSSIIFTGTAFADPAPYTQAGFNALQKEGKSILVVVHAPWCPTCRAQTPVINELLKQKAYQALTVLRVDFDGQKDALKAFNVSKQSTLIVFKGGKEMARSTGDTSPASIEKLLQKAI